MHLLEMVLLSASTAQLRGYFRLYALFWSPETETVGSFAKSAEFEVTYRYNIIIWTITIYYFMQKNQKIHMRACVCIYKN